ncbi:MAG TPA: TonB-dependent receptor [Terriglobia bacterium]|nr:TonB-dependent receptor [Terriglobia bacterium]
MATRLLVRCLLVLAAVWGTRVPSAAQTVNGSFHGNVSDSSGGAIPGATVVVKNAATGALRQTTSDAAGFYTVTEIPPARYNITVSKEGFRTVIQDVELLVAEDREANVSMPVGQVTQQIEVTAQAAALNTTNSTLGTVVGSTQVVDLPLNGRQFTQLILLSPGATPHEGGQQAAFQVSEGGGGISPAVNGQGARFNNYTLDGGLNNEVFKQTWTISPPPDAIEEFKVQSHSVDASVGMAPGANVNVATKTGTNHLHGDAWEFLRNDALDAANFFDNFSNSRKPAYRQNQFGGSVGGPVMLPNYNGREKGTYFFGYYEGFRSSQGFTEFANVPYASELGGNFSDLLTNTQATSNGTPLFDALGRPIDVGQIYNPYSEGYTPGTTATQTVRDPFPGNIIPSNMINPQALLYIKSLYPAANYGPGGNNFPNYSGTSNDAVTGNQFGVRLDHSFGNNDTLFGAFYYNKALENTPCNMPGSCNILNAKGRIVNINYTHVFNPTLLLTLHYMHMFDDSSFLEGTPAGVGLLNALGAAQFEPVRDNYPYVPYGSLSPRFSSPTQFAVPLGPFHTHAINADLQKVAGKHTLGLGYLAYHFHSFDDGWGENQNFDQYPTSAIIGPGANASQTGDGLASLLLNVPSSLGGFEGRTYADTTDLWQGIYVQDKWQVSKKLTVTAGIRWDYIPPMRFKNNQDSGWSDNCSCFLITQPYGTLFPFANVRQRYFDPQWKEFQPRFGIAYAITPKTVVRGGFAIFTDHGGNLIQETQDDRIAWPWGVEVGGYININRGYPTDFYSTPPPASSFFPSPTNAAGLSIFGGANNENKTPTSLQWNFGVEEQLGPSTTVVVDYVGSRDNHIVLNYNDNSPPPNDLGPGPIAARVPFKNVIPDFAYDTNVGYSAYHGLDVKVERRFSQGLTFLGSYTWSHCMDISSGLYDGDPLPNPYNLRSLWGRCDEDYPNVLTFSSVYNLPFGRGRQFGGGWSGPVNAVFGNWQTGGILSANSGAPFSALLSVDNANTGIGGQFAEQISAPRPSGFTPSRAAWYDPNSFGVCAPYTYCDAGRNILRGPGRVDFDLSLSKTFKFTESKSLELRFESFNLFNRVNFASPGGGAQGSFVNFGGAASVYEGTPNYMGIFAAGSPREIQFAAKVYF